MPTPDWADLAIEAGKVFSPTAPIDEKDLFSGRDKQIRQVVDAINQKGQHAIIFGERGVGKTSLANVLSGFLHHPGRPVLSPRVNCDSADSFDSVWRKALEQIHLSATKPSGFGSKKTDYTSDEMLGQLASPDGVRRVLTRLALSSIPVVIIDEFDG